MFWDNTNPNTITGPTFPISIPNLAKGFEMGNVCCIPNIDTQVEKIFPTINRTLFSMILASVASQKYTPDTKTSFKTEYDYIIVGGGSAGSALAARLSEKECENVLLLEAGSTAPILTDIPGIARSLLMTDVNWNFLSEPQKYTAHGLYERRLPFPAGKALGGSSLVNSLLFIRGNPRDYDLWAKSGAEGWAWDDVYPYFLKLEDNADPDIAMNGNHSVGGPVTAVRPCYTPELKPHLLRAVNELGYRYGDPNGVSQIGFSDFQTFTRKGQRCSAAKAYLVPNDKRPNLDIVANAYVTKVQIDREISRATGVYFDFNRARHYVKARKEIIISAGAINTPKILMLSGIGPKETLETFKIPVAADLPVGKNLQDHCSSFVNFVVKAPILTYFLKVFSPLSWLEYITNRCGPLASPQGVFSIAFKHENFSSTPPDYPDYEPYFVEGIPIIAKLTFGIRPEVYKQLYGPYEFLPSMWCLTSVLHPQSVGYVSIRSTDPYAPPVIDPKFLEHPEDRKIMVAGLKECFRIAASNSMKNILEPYMTSMSGCEHLPKFGDEYLECYSKGFSFTISHQSGTAKMGNADDPTTVVDPKLRVKGIQGLRVADASIMPFVISGNTNIPTIMIGEKAADMIKETITKC